MTPSTSEPPAIGDWLLLTYKVPTQSSRARVAVWRDLKRLGALYLQQAVCVLPALPDVVVALDQVRQRIEDLDGTSFSARLADLSGSDQAQLVDGFRANSEREYAEIIEECETKFFKEIEFERFRKNYTYEETEEIGQDLDKLRRWLAKIIDRDWVRAPGRAEAEAKVAECATMLEEFEAEVFEYGGQGGGDGPPS
jgi:hypothetical protein